MSYTIYDQTIALAGVCQVAVLVQNIAKHNKLDDQLIDVALQALIDTNPSSTLAVFGNDEKNLQLGLEYLAFGINNTASGDEIARYMMSLIALEHKLSNNEKLWQSLIQKITHLQQQHDILTVQTANKDANQDESTRDHKERLIGNAAGIYSDVLSQINPRIKILGDPNNLKITSNQNAIRCLLLFGVRSVILWRQVGGKRRHLLFSRRKILTQAKEILQRLPQN